MDRDRELIAHLDALKSHMDSKFDGIDRRFEQMQGQIDRRFKGIDARLDKTEEQIRHTHVLVEGLDSDVKAIAEGQSLLANKLGRVVHDLKVERQCDRAETRSSIRRLCERVERLEAGK